ncbi:LuxR C-terminal-related transcriptional regulator [Streptomyces sp. Root369]|uniref:helix-turn-helix transcriptional regulator n=1 Tax=Streptomyces sp. Root369 TaxID=1736523 RepID=UPI000A999E32|nr:LuxR C-terminal-related transcriptional regulator [Streptomyces sp. Root369]
MKAVLEAGTRPLHGRPAEISALHAAIRTRHHAGSLHVSFEGTPGMGRTRLLAEAGAIAEASGATVVRSLYEDHEEFNGPLIVLLDDTHCSDTFDVRQLADVAMKAASVPTVWCTSRRWGRPNSPLDVALASTAGAHRMFRLGVLDDGTAQEMAHDLLGVRPDAALTRMVASMSGHPQALEVLVQGLLDEGNLEVGEVAHLAHPALPEKFTGLVRRYLQDCSPSCAHMLSVASVSGARLTFAELAEVMGVKPSSLLPDLQEAVLSGLLCEDDDDVRFTNELFRRVILNSVPATARAAVREQIDQYRGRRFTAAPEVPASPGRHQVAHVVAKPVRGFVTAHHLSEKTPVSEPGHPSNSVTCLSGWHACPSGHAPSPAGHDASEDEQAPASWPKFASTTGEAATASPGWDRLTEKQMVIAGLAADGLTNKEIAERLYLSPHTVNYHLRKIFQAMSVRSRNELIRVVHEPSPPTNPLQDTGLGYDEGLRRRGAA